MARMKNPTRSCTQCPQRKWIAGQKAMDLAVETYHLTAFFPQEEKL
jgi:hypothetical protein